MPDDLELGAIESMRAAGVSGVTGDPRRGEGLRIRLRRVPGITARNVLRRPLYLPCVVGDFTITEEFGFEDYLTPAGEFAQPAPGGRDARRLRGLDLEALVIDFAADWLPGGWTDPHRVRTALQELGRSKTACEMLATVPHGRRREEARLLVTLRGMDRVLRPGEADTRYLPLRIKEHRDNRLDRRALGRAERDETRPRSRRLLADDTLRSLADRFDVLWQEVAAYNGVTRWPPSEPLRFHPRFKVGDVVLAPPLYLEVSGAAQAGDVGQRPATSWTREGGPIRWSWTRPAGPGD